MTTAEKKKQVQKAIYRLILVNTSKKADNFVWFLNCEEIEISRVKVVEFFVSKG